MAQQLYQEAREHQGQKQWVACETKLRRALTILETPGLRFHLAFCKEQQHRWVEGLVDYRRASELISGGVEAADVAALLPDAIANLERLTPTLTLFFEETPEGTQMYLDGKPLSTRLAGSPVPVNPGGRRVEVSAPGHVAFMQTINLLPEDRRELRVHLIPERATAETAPAAAGQVVFSPPDPRAARGPVTAQVVVLATEALVTLGALGVGVGFTAEASSRERDRERLRADLEEETSCSGSNPGALCAGVTQANLDARDARDIATVAYIGAAVGAAAFLTTWLLWPESEQSALGFGVDVAPASVAASLRGRF